MRRDAVVAGAQDGVNAVEAGERSTEGAVASIVGGLGYFIKIVASGSLQQIAAGRGLFAQLRAGACQQGPAQDTVTLPHARVGGKIAVSYQRTDPQAPIGRFFDLVERQPVDVD